MGTVNKEALVRAVAEVTGQQLAPTKATIEALFNVVSSRTSQGDTVKLIGFGSFQTRTHKARTARNPRTGEAVEVPEGQRLTFKASKGA